MSRSMSLDLAVAVSADEWAYVRRRLVFLQMIVLRYAREADGFDEWISAVDLAALALPGLPLTRAGIVRKARVQRWRCRREQGKTAAYHVSSLPARAFDALISRMLDVPDIDCCRECDIDAISAAPRQTSGVAAPPWVLPLMRLYRGEAGGDIARAWSALPRHVPAGVELSTIDQAAVTLYDLGLAEKLVPG
jgi:hypothetical protein